MRRPGEASRLRPRPKTQTVKMKPRTKKASGWDLEEQELK